MKTLKLAVIALTAAFSVSAFAGAYPAQEANANYLKDVAACEKNINRTQSFTIQKAEEFECSGVASQKRDIAIHGATMRKLMNSPITSTTVENLFSASSLRSAVVVDGKVTIKHEYFPDGLDVVALSEEAKAKGFASKSWSITKPGHEIIYFAMAVANDNTVLVSALPDDGSSLSAKRYKKLADDEAKREAGKAAKEAAKEASK